MDNILSNHCFSVYECAEAVTTDTEIVRRARLTPLTSADTTLTLATVWATKFIAKALVASNAATEWKFSCKKPLLLKDNELVYTWEFAITGDIEKAISELRLIDRAPLESISIDTSVSPTPLGPPTSSTRKVSVRVTQSGASR